MVLSWSSKVALLLYCTVLHYILLQEHTASSIASDHGTSVIRNLQTSVKILTVPISGVRRNTHRQTLDDI